MNPKQESPSLFSAIVRRMLLLPVSLGLCGFAFSCLVIATFSPSREIALDNPEPMLSAIPNRQGCADLAHAEIQYLVSVSSLMHDYRMAFSEFETSLRGFLLSPSQLFSARQRNKLKTQGEVIFRIGQQFRQLTPPSKYESAHKALTDAIEQLDIAIAWILHGIDTLNLAVVQEGSDALKRSGALFKKAVSMLRELQEAELQCS